MTAYNIIGITLLVGAAIAVFGLCKELWIDRHALLGKDKEIK